MTCKQIKQLKLIPQFLPMGLSWSYLQSVNYNKNTSLNNSYCKNQNLFTTFELSSRMVEHFILKTLIMSYNAISHYS